MNDILIDTNNNGEIDQVHIAPIGQFNGSDAEGNPVPENITAESLEQLATNLNNSDEVLCDVDHKSVKPGTEKDSRAAGWFSRFFVDPIKGLFASLKLTKYGRDLLENREYRYVSPTLQLDGNGVPVGLHSIALTNTPAFRGFINPILNSKPNEEISMTISKEELVDLIKSTVVAMNSECSEVSKTDEVKSEEVKPDETKVDETKTEDVKVDETKTVEEVKNEEVSKADETKVEEPKVEETKVEEPKVEEVIKIESLNSAPIPTIEPEWCNLHGQEFFDWCRKNS